MTMNVNAPRSSLSAVDLHPSARAQNADCSCTGFIGVPVPGTLETPAGWAALLGDVLVHHAVEYEGGYRMLWFGLIAEKRRYDRCDRGESVGESDAEPVRHHASVGHAGCVNKSQPPNVPHLYCELLVHPGHIGEFSKDCRCTSPLQGLLRRAICAANRLFADPAYGFGEFAIVKHAYMPRYRQSENPDRCPDPL